jgi:hypothetical protein
MRTAFLLLALFALATASASPLTHSRGLRGIDDVSSMLMMFRCCCQCVVDGRIGRWGPACWTVTRGHHA